MTDRNPATGHCTSWPAGAKNWVDAEPPAHVAAAYPETRKWDVEYVTSIYITARGIEATSLEKAIEKADAQWRGKYPVVTEPSESAPWLAADDIHVCKEWEVNYDGMDDDDQDDDSDEEDEE
jgi:hypothetical protein